jgi:RHS repeat-associated protein
MWTPNINLATGNAQTVFDTVGRKFFELSNHLGNVLATITDRRVQVSDNGTTPALNYLLPDVVTAQSYYAFGMEQPGLTYNGGSYRYGFNGKENDNEVKGEGNQQEYGMRIYDPRLGRFLSVDPLSSSYPWNGSYNFSEDEPISSIDFDGKEKKKNDLTEAAIVGMQQGFESISDGVENTFSMKTVSALKAVTKNYVGAMTGDPNAARSFAKNVSTFGRNVAAQANAPGQFVAGMANRSAYENTRMGAYYLTQFGLMYATDEFLGMMETPSFLKVPQGLSSGEFKAMSKSVFEEIGTMSDNVVVQGSRASGVAKLESDIDIAIKVNPKKFDELIVEKFGKPNPGSAKYKTMEHAIKTGKIQSGEAKLSGLRKQLEKLLGKEVDISIIKEGGKFDNGVQIPLKIPKTTDK